MIYYRKTLFGRGPKLTAVHRHGCCCFDRRSSRLLNSVNLASVKYFRLGSPLTTTNRAITLLNLEILAVSRTTWYKKD